MARKLYLLLVIVTASGLIAIGCGDDDDDGGGSDEPAQEESGGTGGGTDAPTGEVPANVEQAIEQCKQAVNAAPQLQDDTKADLEDICEKAGSGDEDAVREASKEVCIKIIEDSVPEGPAREQALASCEQAGQQ